MHKHQIMAQAVKDAKYLPSEIPVREAIGKSGLMWPRTHSANHPAADMLTKWATDGCPTDCGPDWSEDQVIAALKRGAHPSARIPEATAYLYNETTEKVKAGHMRVVRWGDIKANRPSNLKLSPVALIPHKSRSFRVILDLSFRLRALNTMFDSVNESTVPLSPREPMNEIGQVLRRIIHDLADHHDPNLPFAFSKLDIKDGFWRMSVSGHDAWNFCYVLPAPKGTPLDDLLIVVPTSLQMGWCESPPFFCTATETGRDTVQRLIDEAVDLPEHPLEVHMMAGTIRYQQNPHQGITGINVYVDDFVGHTNVLTKDHLTHVSRALLHGVHSIFPPPQITGHPGEDPCALKKLIEGDGTWAYRKEILGWIFDGRSFTIQLPEKKNEKLQASLKSLCAETTCPHKEFESLLGKLNHAATGIPCGNALMAPLYRAQRGQPRQIQLTGPVRQALADWRQLLHIVTKQPTSVLELVEKEPDCLGWCDACKYGAGGIWLGVTIDMPLIVWRVQYPADIQEALGTKAQPGRLSINDLEMAGVLLQWLVLEQIVPDLKHRHTRVFCDNVSTVAWTNRLSASSTIGAFLLRAMALRHQVRRASPLVCSHIAGEDNTFADIASRFKQQDTFIPNDSQFLTFFNAKFPPQNNAWCECVLPTSITSRVTSLLRGKPLEMASWRRLPSRGRGIGYTGQGTPTSVASTRFWHSAQAPRNETSSSPRTLPEYARDTLDRANKSRSAKSRKRLRPSPKPSSWLEKPAQSTEHTTSTRIPSNDSSRDTAERTHRQSHNSPFQSQSPNT